MDKKSCFFIGNRYAPNSIEKQLAKVVEQHITEYGVSVFTVGRYGNFDSLVQRVLRKAKERHTDIKLYLLAPYAFNQKTEVPNDFDGTIFPEGIETVPKPYAIVYANRYMTEQSGYLISYCHNIAGNTQKIVEYAKRLEKRGVIKVTLL